MAEWSKALVLGTSLRAWVRIPLQSDQFFSPGYLSLLAHRPVRHLVCIECIGADDRSRKMRTALVKGEREGELTRWIGVDCVWSTPDLRCNYCHLCGESVHA